MKRAMTTILVLFLTARATFADIFDHSAWDQLLKRHVVTINDGRATAGPQQRPNHGPPWRGFLHAYQTAA